jgi:hypothetical protein
MDEGRQCRPASASGAPGAAQSPSWWIYAREVRDRQRSAVRLTSGSPPDPNANPTSAEVPDLAAAFFRVQWMEIDEAHPAVSLIVMLRASLRIF